MEEITLKGRAEQEIKSWYDYYGSGIKKIKEAEPNLLELVELLEPLRLGNTTLSYNSVSITFPTIEEARDLITQILEKTSIGGFVKVSTPKPDRLDWGYYVDYKGIDLTIYPAEPNPNCIPVMEAHTYTVWVCKQKKE